MLFSYLFYHNNLKLQSTMFGGTMNHEAIIVNSSTDHLFVAFSHLLYLFSLSEGIIINQLSITKSKIIALSQHQEKKTFVCLDQKGDLTFFEVNSKGTLVNQKTTKSIFGQQKVFEAIIFWKNEQLQVLAVLQNDKVMRYHENRLHLVCENAKKIMYCNDSWLIIKDTTTSISIYHRNIQHYNSYEHECLISAVTVFQDNLIIGDERGKIHILHNYFKGEVALRQKLQWHVHEVTSLTIEGQYLYSTGQEGVVVMWHLRENKKDFLPRIGTKINNLKLLDSQIYCLLADNTIKSINLNNDKSVIHYKVVVNPHFDISEQSQSLIKSNLVKVSKLNDKLYLRAQPGKLQQINLFSGTNQSIEIISRNLISRLDKNYPNPHQITDISFSEDNSYLAVSLQGVNCKSLRFYKAQSQQYELVSKVQNCHQGNGQANLLCLNHQNTFISYCCSDPNIKIWNLIKRKKQSILDAQESYWSCSAEINYRNKNPVSVIANINHLIIAFTNEIVLINLKNKNIDQVYQLDNQQSEMVGLAVLESQNIKRLIVQKTNSIQAFELKGKTLKRIRTLLRINQDEESANHLVVNQKQSSVALFVQSETNIIIYIWGIDSKADTSYEIIKSNDQSITDIFWIGQRLIALDKSLSFYDITHNQDILNLQKLKSSDTASQVTENKSQEDSLNMMHQNYETTHKHYLSRLEKQQKAKIEQSLQIVSISPSFSLSFDNLAKTLFI